MAAGTGVLLSGSIVGVWEAGAAAYFAAMLAAGFAIGGGAAALQRSRLAKVVIIYAASQLAAAVLFVALRIFAPVLPDWQSGGTEVQVAALAFVILMIPVHRVLGTGQWVREPHVRMPRLVEWILIVAGLALLGGLGWLRVGGNPALRLELLFVAPVIVIGWATGRWGGSTVAILAALVYLLTADATGRAAAAPWAEVTNNLLVVSALIPAAFATAALRRALVAERETSSRDPLTGLWNRRALYEALELELARVRRGGRSFTLACMDLDGFKRVNDELGHAAGDGVLVVVANVVRARLRQTDVAARIGGDEFTLLLMDTDAESARRALSSLNEELRVRMTEGGWPVTFSIGALAGITGGVADDLLRQADELMYGVKRAGKNEVRVDAFAGAPV